jgi:hypothetical protein
MLRKFGRFRKDTRRVKMALLVVIVDTDRPWLSLGIRPCRRYGTQQGQPFFELLHTLMYCGRSFASLAARGDCKHRLHDSMIARDLVVMLSALCMLQPSSFTSQIVSNITIHRTSRKELILFL